jgi:hypothetical protein
MRACNRGTRGVLLLRFCISAMRPSGEPALLATEHRTLKPKLRSATTEAIATVLDQRDSEFAASFALKSSSSLRGVSSLAAPREYGSELQTPIHVDYHIVSQADGCMCALLRKQICLTLTIRSRQGGRRQERGRFIERSEVQALRRRLQPFARMNEDCSALLRRVQVRLRRVRRVFVFVFKRDGPDRPQMEVPAGAFARSTNREPGEQIARVGQNPDRCALNHERIEGKRRDAN